MAKKQSKKTAGKGDRKKSKPGTSKRAVGKPELHPIEHLYRIIASRKGADPRSSYTARLMSRGPAKIAQKLGEEAVEAAIEGVLGDAPRLVEESADLFYHLLALWASLGVKPRMVWRELAKREGRSGIEEKNSRAKS